MPFSSPAPRLISRRCRRRAVCQGKDAGRKAPGLIQTPFSMLSNFISTGWLVSNRINWMKERADLETVRDSLVGVHLVLDAGSCESLPRVLLGLFDRVWTNGNRALSRQARADLRSSSIK